MKIKHRPNIDIYAVEQFYSNKDGVDVKYVCTSALGGEARAMDIFFRETPHPEFGNRYFGLCHRSTGPKPEQRQLIITSADKIEDAEFGMIEGSAGWEYSQHRHDYRIVEGSDCGIDGGRAYVRRIGNLSAECKMMKLVDGKFVEVS